MLKMLIRFAVAAMVMCCTFDAFGAELRYTTDKSFVCGEAETITYVHTLITQGDKEAAVKLAAFLIQNEKCVMSRPGIPVYVMSPGNGVVMIRMKGDFVPVYTMKSSLTNAEPKTNGQGPDVKVPEPRNF